MSKKIEMNYKNSSGIYEPLYPNIIASNVTGGYDQNNSLLSPTTAQKLGLPSGSSLDQAFNQIYEGKAEKVGDIFLTEITSVPSNWGLCNGVEINQSQYPQLYDIINNKYIAYNNYQYLNTNEYPYFSNSNQLVEINGNEYYVYVDTSDRIHIVRRKIGNFSWEVNVQINSFYCDYTPVLATNGTRLVIVGVTSGKDGYCVYTDNLNFSSESDFIVNSMYNGLRSPKISYIGDKWVVGATYSDPRYSSDLQNWQSLSGPLETWWVGLGDYIYWYRPYTSNNSAAIVYRKNMRTLGTEEIVLGNGSNYATIITDTYSTNQNSLVLKTGRIGTDAVFYFIFKEDQTLRTFNVLNSLFPQGNNFGGIATINDDLIISYTKASEQIYTHKKNIASSGWILKGSTKLKNGDITSNYTSGGLISNGKKLFLKLMSDNTALSYISRPIFTDQDYYAYIVMG